MPRSGHELGPCGGRLSRRRTRLRGAGASGCRSPAWEPRPRGRRRRLAGVRAQAHLGRDRVGSRRPADRRADRRRPRRVRKDGVGGTGAGPLRLDGGPAPGARRWGPHARPHRPLRPGLGQVAACGPPDEQRQSSEHRTPRLAEDLRPAARRLQPPARLEPPGRPGACPGAPARPSRLPGGGEAAGRPRARSRPTRVDPRLPAAACRARRGAEPRRRGRRPGGGRLRGAPPGQGLRDRPRSGQRDAVATERSAL